MDLVSVASFALDRKNSKDSEKHGVVTIKWKECIQMIISTAIVSIGSFGTGTVFGWSSVAIADMKQRNAFKEYNFVDHISLIVSLAILGALPGSLIAGHLMDRIGRKSTIITFTFPFVIGWAVICSSCYTNVFYLLFIGRFLIGFSAGGFLVASPTYVKEICSDNLRGKLTTVLPLMLVIGILFAFCIGSFFHWVILSMCCGVSPILLLFCSIFIPESPRFLFLKNRKMKARKAFKWLYSDEISEQDAAERLELLYSEDFAHQYTQENGKTLKSLMSRPVIVPVVIAVCLMFFQQLGGVNAVTLYSVEIFQMAGGLTEEHVSTIMLGTFQVVFVAAAMFTIDTLGRKTLLISSSFVMGCSLIALGTYFYLQEKGDGSEKQIAWVPITAICTYVAAYSIGTGTIPWVLGTEILNPEYRAESATIMTSAYWIFGFVVAKTFPELRKLLHISGCFWFYGGVCMVGAIFVLFFVLETKGKSSEDILNYFGGQHTFQEKDQCQEPEGGGDRKNSEINQDMNDTKSTKLPNDLEV